MNYLIENASVVNEGEVFKADVLVRDGLIADIFRPGDFHSDSSTCATQLPCETRTIDATGKYLIPGIIDEHVHFREPGLTAKADIASESRAAVAGGVTSFMDMPNTLPQTVSRQLLEDKFDLASQKSLANYSFYLGATNDNLSEILRVDTEKLCGIKLFMGSSTGNMLVDSREVLETLFREAPCLIAAHCEDEGIIRRNKENFRAALASGRAASDTAAVHSRIRSSEACYRSAAYAVGLADKTGARFHLLHVSTAAELGLLRNDIPLAEKRITAETCPHYLLLDESRYAELGFAMKCNPAIKSPEDRSSLISAIRSGLIDTVGTDHAPHLREEKFTGDYFTSKSGFPSIQHSFDLMYSIQGLAITDVVRLMCHNPATLYRINRRGFIRKGYHADLAIVDTQCHGHISNESEYSKCGWSPYDGFETVSKVTHTFVNGNLVFENGVFHEESRGQRLDFTARRP